MSLEQKNGQQRGRKLITLLFWIYIAVLLKITIFREEFSFNHLFQNGKLNLDLFTAYIPFLRGGFIWLFIYLFVGNIVWFIPLGGYLVWKHPDYSVWKATMAGFCLSLVIELSQFIFGAGVTELDDLVLNTTGTLIGALIVRVAELIRQNRMKDRKKDRT